MKENEVSVDSLPDEEYLSGVTVDGTFIHERTDALRWTSEKDGIEARYRFAIKELRAHGARTVLDMACGLGHGTWMLNRSGFEVEGLELHEKALEVAQARYPWIKFFHADLMTYEGAPVDGIVATEIIEHIEDGQHFLRQMSKLLNPNGILILSTPNKKYSGSGTNIYHVNEYSIAEFQKLLPGVKIRAISTKLLKPARMWLKLLGKERYMRISYKASLLFPFYNLPQYSRVIAAAVTKEKLDSIFASESNLSQE